MLKTELLPGMPRLAKGPHFLRVSCLVRTGLRFLTLNFFFWHFAERSNIMDDVHTLQVTDK